MYTNIRRLTVSLILLFYFNLFLQRFNFVSTWYEAGQKDINFDKYEIVFLKVPKQTTGYNIFPYSVHLSIPFSAIFMMLIFSYF
jgi:hypothetical protein